MGFTLNELVDSKELLQRMGIKDMNPVMSALLLQEGFHDSLFSDANLKIGLTDTKKALDAYVYDFIAEKKLDRENDSGRIKSMLCKLITTMPIDDLSKGIESLTKVFENDYLGSIETGAYQRLNQHQFSENTKDKFYFSWESFLDDKEEINFNSTHLVDHTIKLHDREYRILLERIDDSDFQYYCEARDKPGKPHYIDDYLLAKLIKKEEISPEEDSGAIYSSQEYVNVKKSLRLHTDTEAI